MGERLYAPLPVEDMAVPEPPAGPETDLEEHTHEPGPR
jgi:hypothetical protein